MSISYTPTSWGTTTAINPTHLNNIENGIVNATTQANENETAISSEAENRTYADDGLMNEGYNFPQIGTVKNYTDSDGVYHKAIRVIDLGTISWDRQQSGDIYFFHGAITTKCSDNCAMVCEGYDNFNSGYGWANMPNKTVSVHTSYIRVRNDTYTDASTFANAMHGKLLYAVLTTEETWKDKSIVAEVEHKSDSLQNEGIAYPTINGISNYVDSQGIYHKRLGCVDLGTLTWTYASYSSKGYSFSATLNGIKGVSGDTVGNLLCGKYTTDTSTNVTYNLIDKTIAVNSAGSGIYVQDTSYTDASTLKSALSGVLLFYELATEQTWNTKSVIAPSERVPYTNLNWKTTHTFSAVSNSLYMLISDEGALSIVRVWTDGNASVYNLHGSGISSVTFSNGIMTVTLSSERGLTAIKCSE